MAEVFGADRSAAACRELTKTYEEIRRGPLQELAKWASAGVKGEVTLVVNGAPSQEPVELDAAALRGLVDEAVATGLSRKDAVAEVVRRTGLPRRTVYDAAHRSDRP
jgi:16S rRNA (cytidine1402-2'-O)-methyltransferase